MPIQLICPQCRKLHNAPDSLAGTLARCRCGVVLQIPALGSNEPEMLRPLPSVFDEPGGGQLQPPPRALPARQEQPDRKISLRTVALLIAGLVGVISVLVCCGGLYSLTQAPRPSAAAQQPLAYGALKLPPLPERGSWAEVEPQVLQQELSLGESSYLHQPGHGGKLIAYLPAGEHRPKSLACVLITAAGSNLLTGMALSEGDRAEHLPYVRAGHAVIAYELDGAPDDPRITVPVKYPYLMFRGSQAGLINARTALEFALAKMPEIDPRRIYAAGHSSAGTHALLFAEYEPRLAGVIAYAPVIDVPRHFGAALRIVSWQLPSVVDFATQSSPHTNVAKLRCSTFLFQAEDDLGCPLIVSKEFVDRLKQQGTDAKLVTVASGGHYDSMINDGVPAAIQWIRERSRK